MKEENGFTLVEVIIVLFIMGILISLAMPTFQGAIENAQKKGCEANLKMLRTQVENYYYDNDRTYPSETDWMNTLINEKYLQATPTCSAGGSYSLDTTTTPAKVKCIGVNGHETL
ncbi:prepilin-type N-terminal cleavage/methylation domain-containing protein [Microaerobacter geothermalis]|uniref:competence type IV pilus major pilin ComGC n=1 Tax=Microaerobacter geothermalis TaxID=674972 RepID=UPI001F3F3A91|nr:prepilin-type N-terminal cleavage/methylation domain-containing protein [Microaerobacter geothermalis]MCF6094209.1 prepilin-type N-terminal cleavage/methylation domain-containing protein [Microaerobacter geothermalis]